MAAIASTSAAIGCQFRKPARLSAGNSAFFGSVIPQAFACASTSQQSRQKAIRATLAVSAPTAPKASVIQYELPTWAQFELGLFPVFWETSSGRPPASGEQLTLWLNPGSTSLDPSLNGGVGFNGGFNSPIMCGGEPRLMTRRDRGPNCVPFYTIKVNVPVYCTTLEFSFTDGVNWTDTYSLELEIPAKWRNMPVSFFNDGLASELGNDGACEAAIFPDAPLVMDRCIMPSSMLHAEAARCDLDIVPGCTDPESPFYDPLATHDDGSCPIDTSDNTI